MKYPSFTAAIEDARDLLSRSSVVNTGHWQGVDIKNKPEAATYEITHFSLNVPLIYVASRAKNPLAAWETDICPNLPWANNHFLERVSGVPLNPGVEWKNWPYANSAASFLDRGGVKFSHSYAERYWPCNAGGSMPIKTVDDFAPGYGEHHMGIYDRYGDLNDLIDLLVREPTTRQAYLPVFFPEDTGAHHGRRVPCTLGYHFLQRNNQCDITYYIRSCDFVRHFRDDIWLTLRLLLWVIERCREQSDVWKAVKPGNFVMHIGSLHMFVNDFAKEFGIRK